MNNDSIELFKFVGLHTYDVNKERTTIYIDPTTSDITIHLYLNRRITASLIDPPLSLEFAFLTLQQHLFKGSSIFSMFS